jgi:hypothetical protein
MFIGYYTVYGPNGYVEGPTREAVQGEIIELLKKHPHALSAYPRNNWIASTVLKHPEVWRATIWSRVELA